MMKKILMMNIIVGCLLLFNSCGVWDMIGAGGLSVKTFRIERIKQSYLLEKAIIDLFKNKALVHNTGGIRNFIMNNPNSQYSKTKSDSLKVDSLLKLIEIEHYSLDYLARKSFVCFLSTVKIFYYFEVCSCGEDKQLAGYDCQINISSIRLENGKDLSPGYPNGMTRQEQQEAIKAFEREILPLIKRNVMRMKQEQ